MNSYTTKELEDLKLYMNYNYAYLKNAGIWSKNKLANAEALTNIMSFFNNYKDPDTIFNKILEFSDAIIDNYSGFSTELSNNITNHPYLWAGGAGLGGAGLLAYLYDQHRKKPEDQYDLSTEPGGDPETVI